MSLFVFWITFYPFIDFSLACYYALIKNSFYDIFIWTYDEILSSLLLPCCFLVSSSVLQSSLLIPSFSDELQWVGFGSGMSYDENSELPPFSLLEL